MITLGVDIAIRNTGYAVLKNRTPIYTERFVSKAEEFYSPAFLVESRKHFIDLLAKFKPDLVVIEGSALAASNYQFSIGALFGVLSEFLYSMSVPTMVIPPMTWKFVITGKGNSDKRRIKEVITSNFGSSLRKKISQDELDAIGLAYTGVLAINYKFNGFKDGMTSKYRKVFVGDKGILTSSFRSWFLDTLGREIVSDE